MAMLRSAIGIALRRTALVSRFFSSGGRGSPGCSGTTSALRRPALASSFFSNGGRGSPGRDTTRRKMCSYGRSGSKGNEGSKAFCYQDFTCMDILFTCIVCSVMLPFQQHLRESQERKWQERICNIDKRTRMMEIEKAEKVNSSFR